MNTVENNILIAKFLGRKGKFKILLFTFKGLYNLIGDTWVNSDGLKFDSDWNWLMLAVQKIDNLRTLSSVEESYLYCAELYGDGARIFDGKTGDVIIEIISGGSWIETTYKLVVEFVKWYNLNK